MRLISLSSPVVDVTAVVAALPARGHDTVAEHLDATAGGGFNAMVAARRHGMDVLCAGAHGTGPFGDLVRRALAASGIELFLAPHPDLDTGLVIVLVDAGGERTFVTGHGAESTLDDADLRDLHPRAGDVVLVSGYGLLTPTAPVAWIRALPDDVVVVLDPGPLGTPDVIAGVRERADWISANAAEAGTLTGHADPLAAAAALVGRAGAVVRTGPQGCVVALSRPPAPFPPAPFPRTALSGEPDARECRSRGTVGAREGACVAVPGFPVDPVDTTGAGDTHTGVFVAALARGADPVAAARTANAAAALSVTRRGPATSPTASELREFLESGAPRAHRR